MTARTADPMPGTERRMPTASAVPGAVGTGLSRSAARTSSAEVRGAAFPEHGFDGGQAHAAGHQRRRGEGPEIKGPGPAEVRRGLEESGGQ